MGRPKNAMEVFSLLDKSNCRKCGEKTCLAFAGAVFTGQRKISECPMLDLSVAKRFTASGSDSSDIEEDQAAFLEALKRKVCSLDYGQAAQRIGGGFDGSCLRLSILGKEFSIDAKGTFSSDIHVNPWVVMPFLTYILECKGVALTGEWISYREMRGGQERYPLFKKRTEGAMKMVADTYTDLFDDLVHMFNAEKVTEEFESDISVVLYPLPLVPVMICYWQAEEGIGSTLNFFFDRSVDDNLGNDGVYTMIAGITTMFEKLVQQHGITTKTS